MHLSLSMIVRNEAERLERCLASVADFVDEMVLLDTGSSDATVAIAERCGATVHHLPWPGDFAPARNAALDLVRGDWVLVLDADEHLRQEARGPLLELMARPDLLVVNLLRLEQGARQSPYSRVSRLFRRHPAIRWSRPYHSMIDDSVLALLQREPSWAVADCPIPAINHEGYRPELLATGDKAVRLRRAMEADLARHPGDPYVCAKLGSLEVSEGRLERGLQLLRTGLRHCRPEAVPERYELLLHLGLAEAGRNPDQAAAHYRQALALPLEARVTLAARLNLAALLQENAAGQPASLEEALQLCQEACGAAPELALTWAALGQAERRRGQPQAAIAAYRQAIARDPEQPELHQNLAAASLLTGDILTAREGFQRAITLLQQRGQAAAAAELRSRVSPLVKLDP